MSLTGDYDQANIFARILRHEIPAARVFEDEAHCAFMDAFPQAPGHTLVVPKHCRVRTLLDCPPDMLGPLMVTAQRIARAMIAAFRADGLLLQQFNGAAAGQSVFHPHIHLVPRLARTALTGHGQTMASMDELEIIAARIADHGEGSGFVRRVGIDDAS